MKKIIKGIYKMLLTNIIMISVGCTSMNSVEQNRDFLLPNIFNSGMVLQRDKEIYIWGYGKPKYRVEIIFSNQTVKTKVDSTGRWEVKLKPTPANNVGQELIINYNLGEIKRVINDVLIGDVWFCSGQSNMEMGMGTIDGADIEKLDMEYPDIRLFMVNKNGSIIKQKNVDAKWKKSSRSSVLSSGWSGFSAIAYIFGREIYKEEGVPIGIIQSAFGGSKIEAWIAPKELSEYPELKYINSKWEKVEKEYLELIDKNKGINKEAPEFIGGDDKKLKPVFAYNALVAPFENLSIKGILWYQGESDMGSHKLYPTEMRALIKGFRRIFKDDNLPFYYGQIAPYIYNAGENLPLFWEAQQQTLDIKNTGIVSTMDFGNPEDIHPTDKKLVGLRFAMQALAGTYGHKISPNGPVFINMSEDNGVLRVNFNTSTNLKLANNETQLKGFEIAGRDLKFYPANGKIDGKSVILTSESVDRPIYLRYAWKEIPEFNLYNEAGLPLLTFRSYK